MRFLMFFFCILLLFFYACKKQEKSVMDRSSEKKDSLMTYAKKNRYVIGQTLHLIAEKAVENWEEYQLMDNMIQRFCEISNTEALSNSEELSRLAKQLKDSIRVQELQTPSVKARLNVLNTECLRLKDMADIPAIKQEEVTTEIRKIIAAFSALNTKLNAVFSKEKLESELELDPDFTEMLQNTSSDSSIVSLTDLKSSNNRKKIGSLQKPKLPISKKRKTLPKVIRDSIAQK